MRACRLPSLVWHSLLLIGLCFPHIGHAKDLPLVLNDSIANRTEALYLLHHAKVLEDPSGKMDLQDAIAANSQFQVLDRPQDTLDRFLSSSTYWLSLDIKNLSSEIDWYFTNVGSLSRKVRLFIKNGAQEKWRELYLLPHSRTSQFHVLLEKDHHYQMYICIQDLHAPLMIDARLRSAKQLLLDTMLMYPLYSFVIGGLLTLALYNFLYFIALQDRGFLLISVFILSFLLEMGNHSGLWFYFNVSQHLLAGLGSTFGLIALASAVLLANYWLDMKQALPFFYKTFISVCGLCFLLIPIQLWSGFGTVFIGLLALIMMPLFLLATILRYRQGFRFMLIWRLGILFVLLSILPSLLRAVGLVGDIGIFSDIMYVLLLVALVMLSMTQAEQVRTRSEQAERVAASNQAKDEFLTTMSHELRTPMNAVVNAGRLLQRTSLPDAQQIEYVARLNTSSQHMLSLINDILDLTRLDRELLHVEQIPFRLDGVLEQVRHLLEGQAHNKQLSFVMTNPLDANYLWLEGDPTRLRQVLLNLLANAIKFTEQGGVRLVLTQQPSSTSDNASVLFEVFDTGIGLSLEQQAQLFQPFSQADQSIARKYGGSGLGLAISQRLVQCMGGSLALSSELGVGSRFYFALNLPVSHEALEQPTISDEESLEGMRVLLVDDDEMNRFFNAELIEVMGASVEVAEGGEEAIALLLAHPFDVVLMDINMPGMDGYATVNQIRNIHHLSIPIIALTAHVVAKEREKCFEVKMNGYLTKPFDEQELKMLLLGTK